MKNKKEFKEVNRYQDSDFPVNVYYADIHSMQPPGRWLHDFHWHEEMATYLKKIIDLFISKQVRGNEYSICLMIVSIWTELISNYRSEDAKNPSMSCGNSGCTPAQYRKQQK